MSREHYTHLLFVDLVFQFGTTAEQKCDTFCSVVVSELFVVLLLLLLTT